MRWFVKAKAFWIDFPRGVVSAIALAILALAVAIIGWQLAYAFCLPGDQQYCARKLLISAFTSLFGFDVPFDFANWPTAFVLSARVMGVVAITVGMLSLLLRNVQHQISAWLMSFSRRSVAITASDQIGAQAAASLRDVVYLVRPTMRNIDNFRFATAVPLGHRWYTSTKNRLFARAAHLLLLDADSNANLDDFATAAAAARSNARTPPHRTVTMRIENFWRRRQVQDELSLQRPTGGGAVRCIATGSLSARRLLAQYPTNFFIDFDRPPGTARFWIVGDTDSSLELLLTVARQSPSRFYARTQLTFIGPNARRAVAELEHHAPMLATLLDIAPHDLAVEFADSANDIVAATEPAAQPAIVYLALENDDLNALWRARLAEAFRRQRCVPPLILMLPTRIAALEYGAAEMLSGSGPISAPSPSVNANTIAAMLQGNFVKNIDDWESLTFDSQEENRALTDHFAHKIRDLFSVREARSKSNEAAARDIHADQISELAPVEHQRWLISHAIMGWSHGAVRDEHKRQHPLMLPWDALPDAAHDRNFGVVRRLLDHFSGAGAYLTRLNVLVVSLQNGNMNVRTERLAALTTESAHVLLLVNIQSAGAMQVIESLAQRTRYGLVLSKDTTPADLPSDSRLAPENIQNGANPPWCVIRLRSHTVQQFAESIGARYVEI